MAARHRHTVRTAAAAGFALAGFALAGCGTEGPETGVDVEDITEGEGAYVGQEVVVSAEVEDVIGDDGLVIAGTLGTTVDPLLVLYDMDRVDIEEGQVVQVTGTVEQAFDLSVLEDFQARDDFMDGFYRDFEQQPYIQATDVTLLPDE